MKLINQTKKGAISIEYILVAVLILGIAAGATAIITAKFTAATSKLPKQPA